MSLFDIGGEDMGAESMTGHLPDVAPFSKDVALSLEKEMLGVYLTDHPLNDFADKIKEIVTVTSEELNHAGEEAEMTGSTSIKDGMRATMAGMIASKRTLITKSNKMMAFLVLEDLYGVSEVVVFPNVYEKCVNYIKNDEVVAITGTINFKEDEAPSLLANNIMPLKEVNNVQASASDRRQEPEGLIKLKVLGSDNLNTTLEQIKFTLQRHRGNAQVLIYLPDGKILKTDRDLWAESTEALKNQLTAILDYGNVKM